MFQTLLKTNPILLRFRIS